MLFDQFLLNFLSPLIEAILNLFLHLGLKLGFASVFLVQGCDHMIVVDVVGRVVKSHLI